MPTSKEEAFYAESIKILNDTDVPFMVGGTYAVMVYTGIERPTKDIDFFCKAGDFPRLLTIFGEKGYQIHIEDERWLAKVKKGGMFFDFIFGSGNAISPVTEVWFKESKEEKILGMPTKILPPTELAYSRMFVQERNKYEGNDVAHLILRQGKNIKWKKLLSYMDQYWEVLLMHVLNFRFIYPSEREMIPRWLLDELLLRLKSQIELPSSKVRVCRGRLLSSEDFKVDIHEWGFADLIGSEDEQGL